MATIKQLIKVVKKIREAVSNVDKLAANQKQVLYTQLNPVEDALFARFTEDKDVEALVETYNNMRDVLDRMDAIYKQEKSNVLLRMEKIEDALFSILRETKSESMRTAHGTAFTSTQTSVKVADWKIFLEHVIESGNFELLKRAASKDAVKAYIETELKAVPGIDFTTRLQVSVRRK